MRSRDKTESHISVVMRNMAIPERKHALNSIENVSDVNIVRRSRQPTREKRAMRVEGHYCILSLSLFETNA